MSAVDVAEFAAKVFAMWAIGFAMGWTITIYRDAASKI